MAEPSPWNEQVAELLLKAVPVMLGSGLGGVIALISTSELPKIMLGAGIGGAGTLGYALVAPSFKKVKKGADAVGEAGALVLEQSVQGAIAGLTKAEAKYLEAQKLACWTDRCQGVGRSFFPLLDEIYVPLSVGDRSILAGWNSDERPDPELDPELARQMIAGRTADDRNPLEIWDLIRRAETHPQFRQLAILAWGGLGKTTLLKHLAYLYSTGRYAEKQVPARIPVLMGLADCWRKYLAEKEKSEQGLPALAEVIQTYHPGYLTSKEESGSKTSENVITTRHSAVCKHDPDPNRV
ncbi:MAG: hypothetical protein HC771_17995 [Synechococcales cyanobacterium CRU_2_2]|nr:hypothetical protein [Synechococcales cyanobacterium CRU_2_2]